jgi:hypothetical protein
MQRVKKSCTEGGRYYRSLAKSAGKDFCDGAVVSFE